LRNLKGSADDYTAVAKVPAMVQKRELFLPCTFNQELTILCEEGQKAARLNRIRTFPWL